MIEMTIRDLDTNRVARFTYDHTGDLLSELLPEPATVLPSMFDIHGLDKVEDFLRALVDEMETFYSKRGI